MFGFLKDKLKSALSVFSKKVDEEGKEVIVEAPQTKEDAKEKIKEGKTQEKESKKELKQKKEEKKQDKAEDKKEEKKSDNKEEKKGQKKEEIAKKVPPKEIKKEEVIVIQEKKEEALAPAVKATTQPGLADQNQGFFSKLKQKFVSKAPQKAQEPKVEKFEEKKAQDKEIVKEIVKEEIKEEVSSPESEEKKGFFASIKEKITTKTISAEQFDELFWDLELVLLENNVAVSVIEKIKNDLKSELVNKPLPRSKIEEAVMSALKNSVSALFDFTSFDLIESAKKHAPFIVCLVGVNGSGKTTSIAKLVRLFEKNKLSCVIAAADTFRAAAIDQLQVHADALNVKLIKHDYGADAAAVAFDAIKHAEAKHKDVVLIDTAGRLHSNVNLMDEMKKIIRVAKPDLKIFIGESITGNDCVEQARLFDEAIGIDGIILSKADIDEKGGASLSVSYVTKKPILYLGTGQNYDDLEAFDKEKMIKRLGL